MTSAPPAIRVQAAANYHAARNAITKGLFTTVFKKDVNAWRQWRRFCSWLQIAPDLKGKEDPVIFLHIFAERVRAGLLSVQGQPIKKEYVEQYLRSIGQIFASVGAKDLCHNRMGRLGFRLGRQLASYQKEDSPPTRVRRLSISVIQALDTSTQGTTPRNIGISNLTWVAFLILLLICEYCKGGTDTAHHPFRLKDVQFFIGQHTYNAVTASNAVLDQTEFFILLFTTQKNGLKGESIGHSRNGRPQGFPVAAMNFQVA